MSALRISLAGPERDAELRALAAASPMPGPIGVSYTRDPSFFDSLSVHGFANQVVIAEDPASGAVVGTALRSVRHAFVNGEAATIGYLSGLRLRREHRDSRALLRGARFFRELHRDGTVRLYTTTILESNTDAARLLTSGRLGLPRYVERGRYVCAALRSKRATHRAATDAGLVVRAAGPADAPGILALWERHGARRQFCPRYTLAELERGTGALRGLALEDVALALRGDTIVGTAAAWDQSGFRQSVIHRYSRPLGVARPLYNLWTAVSGRPKLPPAGAPLAYRVLALTAVDDDEPAVLDELLDHLLAHRLAPGSFLLAGLHERDPLLPVIEQRATIHYDARLYVVFWDEDRAAFAALDERIPYLELGAL